MSGTFDCIKNGEPSDKEEENKMFNTCGTSEKPIVMAKFVADGAEDVCMRYMSVVIDGVRYATGRAASGSVETDYGLLRKDLCRILGDKRERVVFPRDRLIAVIKTPPRELPKSACFVGTRAEDGYVTMTMLFTFVRPKSVKAKKRPDMTVKPDLDKLCRTVLDALTGVAYKDDSQVIGIIANKRYGEVEMLHVKVVSG